LPIPIITYLYVAEKNVAINFAQKEIYGAEYLAPLKAVAREMARHRDAAYSFQKGSTAAQDQISDAERAIDQRLAEAEDLDQKDVVTENKSYGALLQTTGRLRAIKQKWGALKEKTAGAQANENFVEHTQLIAETLDLIKHAGNQSNLILDPNLDSYYLMDAVVIQIPRIAESVSRLRGLGSGIAVSRRASQEELAELTDLIEQTQGDLSNLERAFNVAHDFNAGLKEKHAGQIEVVIKEVGAFANLTDRRLVRARAADLTPQEYLNTGTQTIDRLLQVDDLALADLQPLIKTRMDKIKGERNVVLGLTLGGLLLTIFVVGVIASGVTRQANGIKELIADIDQGNLDARAEVMSGDEMGRAALAFNQMLDNTRGLLQSRDERDQIQRSIVKLLDEVSAVAKGDLTSEAEVTADITGAIADAFNYMITNLRQLISQVQNVTSQVTSTASETQTAAERLAQGSQEQAAQITNTSSAISEMTSSILEVSENASFLATVADQSLHTARKGADAVQNTVKGMSRIQEQVRETSRRIRQLSERSEEIEEIVQLIDEIADRTGVLALNASIQASAAGEAGQGFAVVAAEVEQLAGRSAEATKRITNLVKAIQGGTGEAISAMEETSREVVEGAKLAHQAGDSLKEIGTVSNQLADLVRSISLSCQQHARRSEIVSKAMAEIATITNQTTDGVIQSAVTVKSLAELADELRASVASFKLPHDSNNGNNRNNGRRRL
ncbi:MAG: methyl-accepting chemotaxis protein, partial [Blastocatellia bacterium]